MRRFEHGGNVYAHPNCVDFSANLNPLGIPEGARKALASAIEAYGHYPDPNCTELAAAIAAFEHVPEDWVLCCAGATDVFYRMCAATKPLCALVCDPCYSGYEQALEQNGATVLHHALLHANNFDVTAELASAIQPGIDLLFVANPNNPTGRCMRRDVLLACLERAHNVDATVVLDECFVDLSAQRGSNALLAQYPNLLIAKALTKTFCLAGLRVGYALSANARLLERMRDAGQPWSVSVPAQVAGVAALQDTAYLRRARQLIQHERTRLHYELGVLGANVVPSEASYLLLRARANLYDDLLEQGILVRPCGNYDELDECWYRVAVRMPAQNDLLVAAMRKALR